MINILNPKWTIPLNGQWVTFTGEDLKRMNNEGKKSVVEALRARIEDYETNKLRYFLPHGIPRHLNDIVMGDNIFTIPPSQYPDLYDNDGQAFLSDTDADVSMLIAPNQCGKTQAGCIWTLLRLIPCDPKWEIFTENKVKYIPWTKPRIAVVATYSWPSMVELWDKYLDSCPRDQLGDYARKAERRREIKFGDGKPKRMEFACGSKIMFLCYSQKQAFWESFPSDFAQLDEQVPQNKFIGWIRSTTTRGDDTQCCMTLTGHVLDGRSDTGAGGWIKRSFYDGYNDMGLKISRYHMSVETVPDAIITPAKKKELWKRWVDPSIERSDKQKKEAIARYWGGWEEGSGLVFDMFEPKYHVIEPLWDDDKVPPHLPKWRVIDFGKHITCVSWFALLPTGEGVCYRAMYIENATVASIAQKIAEMSYNEFRKLDARDDSIMGVTFDLFEEIYKGEEYVTTLLDSRSAGASENGKTILDLFRDCGINVTASSGQKDDQQIPRLREWLAINPNRQHIITKKDGAPMLYIFDGRAPVAISELVSYRVSQINPEKPDLHQLDHWIDTAKYWVSDNPDQFANYAYDNQKKVDNQNPISKTNKDKRLLERRYGGYL